MSDVLAQSPSLLLLTMLGWWHSEQDTILWIKITTALKEAMFLDRAMVVIHRLWPKPFRFITTHSTQCTLPDRAAGHHTNLHVPQSSEMYGSIQSPVVRDSALGFLPAHFGLFALNFFSLILIEESNYLVLFLHFFFKFFLNISKTSTVFWCVGLNLYLKPFKISEDYAPNGHFLFSFKSQHFFIFGYNKSCHTCLNFKLLCEYIHIW